MCTDQCASRLGVLHFRVLGVSRHLLCAVSNPVDYEAEHAAEVKDCGIYCVGVECVGLHCFDL